MNIGNPNTYGNFELVDYSPLVRITNIVAPTKEIIDTVGNTLFGFRSPQMVNLPKVH